MPIISPRPRTSATSARSSSPRREAPAELADAPQQLGIVEHIERGQRRRGDQRPAGEGRAVVAGLEAVADLGCDHTGADRQAAAEGLRGGDHVGPRRELLVGPERAGPPHPGLDLVEEQQGAGFAGGVARGEDRLLGDDVDAGLALDRLEHHRGGRARRRPREDASGSSRGTARKPGRYGAKSSFADSPGVAERAPMLRP